MHNSQTNYNKVASGFTSFMTPNTNTSRNYEAGMQDYGV